MIDSVGAAVGQDFGLGNSIAGMQAAVNSGAVERGTAVVKDLVSPSAPAVANRQAASASQAAALGNFTSAWGAPKSDTAFLDKEIHVHSVVKVDGEKLAEAHSVAKRSRDPRSFHSVPSAEGAF